MNKSVFLAKSLALIAALLLAPWSALAATAEVKTAAIKTAPEKTAADNYLDIPQAELVYLELEQGIVVLKLAPQFTPEHSKRFIALVQAGFYNGLDFYRVIDQFVLQAGLIDTETHPYGVKADWPALKAEFSWPARPGDPFTLVQQDDLLAKQTGFNQGFAVGRDNGEEWLLHCPNVINMARSEDANSATTDFALMQGQAPRHLDRNMSVFAKVIWGGQALNLVKRGERENGGIIDNKAERSRIIRMTLGSDLPKAEQLPLQWLDTASAEFKQRIATSRARDNAFFRYKGNGALDICYQQVPVRLKPAQEHATSTKR